MYKIVLINHTFSQEHMRKRWKMFAEQHKDIDLYLIAPKEWIAGNQKQLTFGSPYVYYTAEINEDNYHVVPVDFEYHKLQSWTSKGMVSFIKALKPNLVYHIGSHLQDSLMQCFKTVKKLPFCKMVVFSMRGPNHDILFRGNYSLKTRLFISLLGTPKVKKVNKYSDAIMCHYPDAVKSFQKEGYKGPIYIQTQVGVDTEKYKPNVSLRKKIRDKYQIGNAFLFGSASRFAADKGVDDILDSLPKTGNWKYLLMGGGLPEEEQRIKAHIEQLGIRDKVIMTGYIAQSEMNEYWNALDCAVHIPRTAKSSNWIETFSVALVQAMATNIPVIGDTSGSVPYQIGPNGIIVREGNIAEINEKMEWVMTHSSESKMIGDAMRWRAVNCFSIQHLDDCIYDIFIDVINGIYDKKKYDMAEYKVPSNPYGMERIIQ